MTEEEKLKIMNYPIDDSDSILKFSRRLAMENNWTYDYTLRVIEEYKKFVILAMVAGHKVTPSDEVDQVWHLHLLYTEDYWMTFSKLLPFPLHHGPTKGGKKEDEKYEDWYNKTLESYRKEFNSEPPVDIWPPSELRFGRVYVRVNIFENIIIKTTDYPFISKIIIKLFKFINK